jgi:hypothetical protein
LLYNWSWSVYISSNCSAELKFQEPFLSVGNGGTELFHLLLVFYLGNELRSSISAADIAAIGATFVTNATNATNAKIQLIWGYK